MFEVIIFLARVYVGAFFVLAGLRKWVAAGESWRAMCLSLGLPAWFRVLFPYGQFVGGLLLAFGLFTPWAALFIAVTMVGAFALWHCPKTCAEYPGWCTTGRWVNLGMSVELAYVLICGLIFGATIK